jgi:hypothetical protein
MVNTKRNDVGVKLLKNEPVNVIRNVGNEAGNNLYASIAFINRPLLMSDVHQVNSDDSSGSYSFS